MNIVDIVRAILPPDQWQFFSERALWAAGESQKPTAIPALVLVGSGSLLVVLAWVAVVGFVWRWLAR